MKTTTKTVTLRGGAEVLAKEYAGGLSAVTYANRTQAERKASALGAGWYVFRGLGRPFYVRRYPVEDAPLCGGRTIWNSDGTDGPVLICAPTAAELGGDA